MASTAAGRFARLTKPPHQLIERFYCTLLPGSWLIVGHAKPQASTKPQLELHNFPKQWSTASGSTCQCSHRW
jgi:hypothetical protein